METVIFALLHALQFAELTATPSSKLPFKKIIHNFSQKSNAFTQLKNIYEKRSRFKKFTF